MKRKLLSVLLTLCLAFSLLPTAALAEGGEASGNVAKIGEQGYATLAEAVAAAKDGETVTLLADVTKLETISITGGKKVDLNLNEKNITFKADNYFLVPSRKASSGRVYRVSRYSASGQAAKRDGGVGALVCSERLRAQGAASQSRSSPSASGRNAVTRWAYVRARMSAKALSVTVHPSFSRPSLRHGASPASAADCPSKTA